MELPKPIQERRRSVRIEELLPLQIGHGDDEIFVTTVNIGYHGALCVLDRDIRVMTRLRVALTLPSASAKITAKGVVIRKEKDAATGKFYVAIYFSDIAPKDAARLKKYIDRRLGR